MDDISLSFTIPTGALECVERLWIGNGRRPLMVLCGDKGYSDLSVSCMGLFNPILSHHASVSVRVNFDALHRFAKLAGGVCWLPQQMHSPLKVSKDSYIV